MSVAETQVVEFRSRVLHRHPDAAFQMIDEMATVVLPGRGEVKVLNRVGARVWDLMDGARSLGEILEIVLSEYDTNPEELEKDVRDFVRDLERSHMLEQEGR